MNKDALIHLIKSKGNCGSADENELPCQECPLYIEDDGMKYCISDRRIKLGVNGVDNYIQRRSKDQYERAVKLFLEHYSIEELVEVLL